MASNIWVKVVGFSDAERHSLNTLFQLSSRNDTSYSLWTPEGPSSPHIALIDFESYEARLELASPSFNTNMRLICVGKTGFELAWRSFQRPVDWGLLIRSLDELFTTQSSVDIDLGMCSSPEKSVPPGVKISLIVGLNREDQLYLRARLALAGFTDVDEVQTTQDALVNLARRQYDLLILSLDQPANEPWSLVHSARNASELKCSVIVTSNSPTWRTMERAEKLGCAGLLEVPFNPRHVRNLLQMV